MEAVKTLCFAALFIALTGFEDMCGIVLREGETDRLSCWEKKRTISGLYHNILLNKTINYERNLMRDYLFDEHFDKYPIAMAYVPWQRFDKMYDDLDKAFKVGTVFPELNKPFTGRRCVK